MDFLILGPLEARVDGRELPLGGTKQRALLALLLLHRNEVVSTDRLIDGLWGEEPPATALKVVQVYVSRLRRLLGQRGRLLTRPPGYLLQLDPEELDLDRFEALVERGAAGRWPRATPPRPRRPCAGGSPCGGARRWPTSPSSPSPRRPPPAWRSSGWPRSRAASRPTSPSAAPPS